MKKFVMLFLLAAAGVVGWKTYKEMAPAEKKIQWLIQDAAEAFNTMKKAECMNCFSETWRDVSDIGELEEQTISRDQLGRALSYLFTTKLEPDTKQFLYKIEPAIGTLSVTKESEESAKATFRMEMSLKMGHKWTQIWGIDVKCDLISDGKNWRIQRSSYRTTSGTAPISRDQ